MACSLSTLPPVIDCRSQAMFEVILGGTVAAGLAVYLIYTLIRPEKF